MVGETDGDVVGPEVVGEIDGDVVGSEVVGGIDGEIDGDTVGSEVVGGHVTPQHVPGQCPKKYALQQ